MILLFTVFKAARVQLGEFFIIYIFGFNRLFSYNECIYCNNVHNTQNGKTTLSVDTPTTFHYICTLVVREELSGRKVPVDCDEILC